MSPEEEFAALREVFFADIARKFWEIKAKARGAKRLIWPRFESVPFLRKVREFEENVRENGNR